MLFLLSPAKSLDYQTPVPSALAATEPLFTERSQQLIAVLQKKSARQISAMMDLSEKLATLNVERYRAWQPSHTPANARQAVWAFDGDVYDGLQAKTLKPKDLQWAQEHLCILSGLYGVLRPFDMMQPYRLEMGTALAVARKKNLYQFWGADIAHYLDQRAQQDKVPLIVNLASQEYFKSVDRKALQTPVLECVFEEERNGQYKVISFSAKRARGMMARFAVCERLGKAEQLKAFNADGYAFSAAASSTDRFVFRRAMP